MLSRRRLVGQPIGFSVDVRLGIQMSAFESLRQNFGVHMLFFLLYRSEVRISY